MEKNTNLRQIILILSSLVLILIPILLWLLWINCFDLHDNHTDRVKMFINYFPIFLRGQYTISLISLLFSTLGTFLILIYWQQKTQLLKIISTIIIITGLIVTGLTLFTLM